MLMTLLTPVGGHGRLSAAETADHQGETLDLFRGSHAVIIGRIEKRRIGISETIADIRVISSIAGPLSPGRSIQLRVLSGRVKTGQDQPELTGVTQAVFFLTPPDPADGRYTCLQDNYGFKPIIHDRVYLNPQDPRQTVQLKKYQETLASMRS